MVFWGRRFPPKNERKQCSSGNSVIAFPYCEYPEPYLQSRKEVNTYTTYLVFIVETFSSDIDVVIPKLRLF